MTRRTPAALALVPVLALALAAPAAAQQGDTPDTLTETYSDWLVRCAAPAADGQRQCEMVQEVRERAENGRRVLSLALQRADGEATQITAIGPFGLRLADGLGLRVDEADPPQLTIPFLTCVSDGCIAVAQLEPELRAVLQDGATLEAVLVAVTGEPVRIGLSLAGFTAAWNRLGALR
jgi:invasion protein IalB